MKKFTMKSQNGMATLACYEYAPDQPPRAMVQICHGMCEYIGRYEPFIAFLNQNGFLVFGHDHCGHGSSTKNTDELGFFGESEGDKNFALDTHNLTVLMREKYPELPCFLLGHSMGSFITRDYIEKFGKELDGCIIMGTAGANPAINIAIGTARFFKVTHGSKFRSKLINQLAFGQYNKRIANVQSPHDWLTKDRKIVADYDRDPYCNFIFTARGYEDLFLLLKRVNRSQWADSVPKTLPLFVVAGQEDPVGNYGKGPTEVYNSLCAAGVQDIRFKLYPDCRHEILNEPECQEVFEDILNWLSAHL